MAWSLTALSNKKVYWCIYKRNGIIGGSGFGLPLVQHKAITWLILNFIQLGPGNKLQWKTKQKTFNLIRIISSSKVHLKMCWLFRLIFNELRTWKYVCHQKFNSSAEWGFLLQLLLQHVWSQKCVFIYIRQKPLGKSELHDQGQLHERSGADRTQVGPMLAPWTLLTRYSRQDPPCSF